MIEGRTVVVGGFLVDGAGSRPRRGDIAMRAGKIEAVGEVKPESSDAVVDAAGRYLLPGFIDAHSHADAAVFEPEVQLGLLRQGVTSIIAGQDGVSFAPGDGKYASDYFGALNGRHPGYAGGGVTELLAGYDRTIPVNVGYLIPAGTVRHVVMGYALGRPTSDETSQMQDLVRRGLDAGALGLSTGLDYIPNMYADTAELTELCRPVAAVAGIYVSHMRGGYEGNAAVGTAEIEEIALATGVSAHISHFIGPTALLTELVAGLEANGVDLTFDTYPYRRGFTLLTMLTLPPSYLAGTNSEIAASLREPSVRASLLETWFPALKHNPNMGPQWADNLTLAHVGASRYGWAQGLTVNSAAERMGVDAATFTLDLLVESDLEVSAIRKASPQRTYDELAELFTHPAHVAGSDGIYIGNHPHPRGWGTFAKYLRVFTRDRGDFGWPQAAEHLSRRTADRFCIGDRGRLRPGYAADLLLVDPSHVADRASYDFPRETAVGIDDVFVGGEHVLADGTLTGINSGQGLRRSTPVK